MSLSIFYADEIRDRLPENVGDLVFDSQAILHLEDVAKRIAILVGTADLEIQYFVVSGEACNKVFFNIYFPSFEVPFDDAWTMALFLYSEEFVWNFRGGWGTDTEGTAVWVLSAVGKKLIPHLKRIEGKLGVLVARLEHVVRLWEGAGAKTE